MSAGARTEVDGPLPASPIMGEVKSRGSFFDRARSTDRHLPHYGGGWEGVVCLSRERRAKAPLAC